MCILLPKNHTGLNSYKYMHLYIQVYKKTPIDVARELGAGGGGGRGCTCMCMCRCASMSIRVEENVGQLVPAVYMRSSKHIAIYIHTAIDRYTYV